MNAIRGKQTGFIETDIKTSLGAITIEIHYTLRTWHGENELEIDGVTNSYGDDLGSLFNPDAVHQEVYECLEL